MTVEDMYISNIWTLIMHANNIQTFAHPRCAINVLKVRLVGTLNFNVSGLIGSRFIYIDFEGGYVIKHNNEQDVS